VGRQMHRGTPQKSNDHIYYSIPAEDQKHEQSWYFNIPLKCVRKKPFKPDPLITVTSRHFHVTVLEILQEYMKNYLAQLDEYEDRLREISGRTKSRHANTELIVGIHHRGASATHNGRYIRIGAKIYFRDNPALWHDFGHELAHNFGLTHGGMHELIIEAARCGEEDLISGQASKWLFMDRMNGLQIREKWYPYTAYFLYAYSQGGREFLRYASENDYRRYKKSDTVGLSKEEALAAFMSIALGKDMYDESKMYGLCDSQKKFNQALRVVKQCVCPPKEKN
jgi:hypothetical protein